MSVQNDGPKAPPPPAEQSLKYMAWDIKTLGTEVKNMNVVLQRIAESIVHNTQTMERLLKQIATAAVREEKPPF